MGILLDSKKYKKFSVSLVQNNCLERKYSSIDYFKGAHQSTFDYGKKEMGEGISKGKKSDATIMGLIQQCLLLFLLIIFTFLSIIWLDVFFSCPGQLNR